MEGRCLCGGVAFEFGGPTTDIELCHCSRCQRATGSAFAPDFWVRADRFRWVQGEDLISTYDAPVIRQPPAYRNTFCRTCGSPLPVVRQGSLSVRIPAGLVQGDFPARVVDHIHIGKKAWWWNPSEIAALPAYGGAPPVEVRARMFAVLDRE